MIKKFLLMSCLSLGLLSISTELLAAKAGYYRWTDAEGEVHFTQKPPPGKPHEFIETQTGKRSVSDDDSRSASTKANSVEAEADSKMEVLPPKDPELCQRAQGNMQSLSIAGARIKSTGKDGQVRYLTPDEIEIQKLRAQEIIKLHCE